MPVTTTNQSVINPKSSKKALDENESVRESLSTKKRRVSDENGNAPASTTKNVPSWVPLKDETPSAQRTASTAAATPGSIMKIRRHLFNSPSSSPPATPECNTPEGTPNTARRLTSSSRPSTRAGQPTTNGEPMKVYLRIRPLSNSDGESCISWNEGGIVTIKPPKDSMTYRLNGGEIESKFTFSGVLGETSGQTDVFQECALPLLSSFLSGTNGLLFSYGVTNAGKTYTINGTKQQPGILPRILDVIFNSIPPSENHVPPKTPSRRPNPNNNSKSNASASELEYSTSEYDVSSMSEADDSVLEPRVKETIALPVRPNHRHSLFMSFMEIYNERIFDLLQDDPSKRPPGGLPFKEDKAGRVFAKSLVELTVKSAEDGHRLLQRAMKNRQMANTLLNQDSSRGHCVIQFKLVELPIGASREELMKDSSLIRYSKLSVIDLAGSERNSRTKTSGARLKEAANINTSLMTLGRCIDTMRWNQFHPNGPAKVVPFRDSKLTRLFQDYFVGNGKASMIVNVNPSSADYEETCNVLKFSAMAKEVVTVPRPDISNLNSQKKKEANASTAMSLLDSDEVLSASLNKSSAVNNNNDENSVIPTSSSIDVFNDVNLQDMLVQERCQMEAALREEIGNEADERIRASEEEFKKRVAQEVARTEGLYEKKLELLQQMYNEQQKIFSSDANNNEELLSQNEELQKRFELKDKEAKQAIDKKLAVEADNVKLQLEVERLNLETERLEEELNSIRVERDNELKFWQKKTNELEEKYKLMEAKCQELTQKLDEEKSENQTLKNRVQELMTKAATPKKSRSPFSSLGKEKGQALIHAATSDHDNTSNIALPKKSRIVTTPTKRDLMKNAKYSVIDVQQSQSPTSVQPNIMQTTFYTGEVEKSVTGGVSVTFTNIDQLTQVSGIDNPENFKQFSASSYATPDTSRRVSRANSMTSSPDSPTITVTPPGADDAQSVILFDPLQTDALLREDEDYEDAHQWQDVSLEDDPKEKKNRKKEEKERQKEEKKRQEQEKKMKKEQEKKEKKAGKKGPTPADSPVNSSSSYEKEKDGKRVLGWFKGKDSKEETEEQDEETSPPPEKKRGGRKLYNAAASDMLADPTEHEDHSLSSKKGGIGRKFVSSNMSSLTSKTPIAQRLRNRKGTK